MVQNEIFIKVNSQQFVRAEGQVGVSRIDVLKGMDVEYVVQIVTPVVINVKVKSIRIHYLSFVVKNNAFGFRYICGHFIGSVPVAIL